MNTQLLSSAAAAWRHLVATAGFDPDGYDAPLVRALRDPVEGLGLDPTRDIAEELSDRKVSVEEFLAAFFRVMRPYGRMLQDLLDLFTEAGAQFGEHNLAVEFDFGRGVDLGFDVEQFRQWLAQWARAIGSVAEAQWNTDQLWQLVQILRHRQEGNNPALPELNQWNLQYREFRRWPEVRVSLPATGDLELDELLQRGWRLWETVLRECAAKSRDREDLARRWRESWNRDAEDRDVEDDQWPLRVLGSLDSDLWPASLLNGLISTAHEARTPNADWNLLNDCKARLKSLFASLPSLPALRESWVLEWQAYLDLPLWKRRHELYSAWVSTQILAATAPLPRRVHCEDLVLRFAFGGSHIATLPTLDPAVHLWAELRSPIEHRPVGLGRKTRIQPDFTLLSDPLTGKSTAILVVECKQYKHASKKNFLAAMIDYARGRPNAAILLVNYGPAPSLWVDEAPPDVRSRLHLIGEFRPGSDEALGRFGQIVGETLTARARAAATRQRRAQAKTVADARPDPPLRQITLRWSRARDLDLHLRFSGPGREDHVHFRQPGSLGAEPWMALAADVQSAPGREEIKLERYYDGDYRCFAHSWSGEQIENSEAVVEVEFNGSTLTMTCPRNGSGRWWHVFDWSPRDQGLKVIGRVTGEELT